LKALLVDFNGTLSDDEPVLYEVWRAIFAARGKELSSERYYSELAGLSDPEIAERWLGRQAVKAAMEMRVALYRVAAGDGSTVRPAARDAIRYAAARVPVAIVSGAARSDVELVVGAARLREIVTVVVAAEDVVRGKPDPAPYRLALERLGVSPSDAVALEDSEPGIAAAKAAGLRCLALSGTLPPHRLVAADEVVERLDVALMRRLLGEEVEP
jgi:beta-phosphoglucomutase